MRIVHLNLVTGVSFMCLAPAVLFAAEPERVTATLIVRLPANAILILDDYTSTSTSSTRSFVTPPLVEGKDYHYTLSAEFGRGSMNVTLKEVISVRAGKETIVDLDIPGRLGRPTVRSYFADQPNEQSSYGGYSPASAYSSSDYEYGAEYRSYSPAPPSIPRVAPASEQDPMRGAGPPGSNSPLSLGVGQG
jgi:uncharacterized protein (TIGR03000 family)